VAVAVEVLVDVRVAVAVDGKDVFVAVKLGGEAGVLVAVDTAMAVAVKVSVGVYVDVAVPVNTGVPVGVLVRVGVNVGVVVEVGIRVAVGVGVAPVNGTTSNPSTTPPANHLATHPNTG
jgi:hypothetical protein